MALTHDRYTTIVLAPSVANLAAPTLAEIAAGINLSTVIMKDGVGIPDSQNMADNAAITDTWDAQLPGTEGGPVELIGKRHDASDLFWLTFDRDTIGVLIIRRTVVYSTAFAAGQKCECYPIQAHRPIPLRSAANDIQKAKVTLAVTAQPQLKATVAA